MGRFALSIALVAALLIGAVRLLPARRPRGLASLRAAEAACRLYMDSHATPPPCR